MIDTPYSLSRMLRIKRLCRNNWKAKAFKMLKQLNPGIKISAQGSSSQPMQSRVGKVLFPRQGCEELISQIVHFGVEAHDDLADAFSNVILNTLGEPPVVPRVWFV